MKKVITTLVQRTAMSSLPFLLLLMVFFAVHAVAFLTGDFAVLRLFYPLLCVVLITKTWFER